MSSRFCSVDDSDAFRLLFDLESYLRVLVRWELRGTRPCDWQGMISQEIRAEVKRRREQERSIGYLDERKAGELSYLLLSELKDLIVGPLWDRFRYSWPPKDVIQAEFKKLLAIRNKVAHCRPVTERDARVARRFAEDIAEWTRHYRRERQSAPRIDYSSGDGEAFFDRLPGWSGQWKVLLQEGLTEKFRLVVEVRGHHVYVQGSAIQRSVEPSAVEDFMDSYQRVLSFCGLGKAGEELTCYVPRNARQEGTSDFLERMVGVLATAGELLSESEARTKYRVAGWEGLLPGEMELPLEFGVSH